MLAIGRAYRQEEATVILGGLDRAPRIDPLIQQLN